MSPDAPGQALVVGGGTWGINIVRTLHALNALAGVCEAQEARRVEVARLCPETPLYASLDDMLAQPALSTFPVFVATPSRSHFGVASSLLAAGHDVMVEKPMTTSLADARQLVDLARLNGRVLMVGHLLLYSAAVDYLKEHMQELGALRYLTFQRLNLGRVRREENVLWSFAPHDIAVMLYLTGEWPQAVSCTAEAFLQPEIEDVAWMRVRFPSGCVASIHVGWLEPERVRMLKIIGDRASAILNELATPPLTIVPQRVDAVSLTHYKEEPYTPALDATDALRHECLHFLACAYQGATPRSPGDQGLAVVHILECATESLQNNGQWVHMECDDALRSRISADR